MICTLTQGSCRREGGSRSVVLVDRKDSTTIFFSLLVTINVERTQ